MERKYLCGLVSIMCICCLTANASGDSPAKHTFSLVIREGFGSIAVGDLNTTLNSLNYNPVYEYLREYYPEQCVGEIREVPNGFKDWEVEFQWAAWWGFSVGIAIAGPTRFHDKSSLTYSIAEGARQTTDDTFESDIRVSAPIRINLYRSFPIVPNIKVVINGGFGNYQTRMTHTRITNMHLPPAGQSLLTLHWEVSGRQVGTHCGFALEYKFNDRFSMIAESQWRFAKVNSLEGIINSTLETFDEYGNLGYSFEASDEGPLYHYYGEDDLLGVVIEKLLVTSLEPPWNGIDSPYDIRKAFLDLSGYTFKIGLRIKMF
jgi:hypothetical protein